MRTLLWSASLARATDTCVQNRPELLARASLYYCPNDAFLALAQREFPCATTFLDVGANKGYTAVEMLAYWAPGSVTPHAWWRAHVDDAALPAWSDEFRKGRNIGYQCGSCHECLDRPAPRGTCERGGKVNVHSFDGSPALAAVAKRVWSERFEASSEASWRYTVAAVAERGGGTVRFSNSSEEQGAISRDAGGVEVPATTVDDYARTNNLAVDVLKIDTEGNDGLVLLGAAETLRSPSLKLVYFEYAVAPTWFERRGAFARAAKGCEIPNFKGSDLGQFPLVSADFWTSDHPSERSRRVDAFSGTRARGTLTLKRR